MALTPQAASPTQFTPPGCHTPRPGVSGGHPAEQSGADAPQQFFQSCAFAKISSSLVMLVSARCRGLAHQVVMYQGLLSYHSAHYRFLEQ
jgi:hypothetical protein